MLYSLLRPALFSLDPEDAHGLTLSGLDFAQRLGLLGLLPRATGKPVHVMGIDVPNPVGLAAGLDKDGAHINALAALGFGFIEIGTVTPRPQSGNPKPRLFRLPQARAIINRMGFNNLGVDNLVRNVEKSGFKGVLGINIGKNKDTQNLRELQKDEALDALLSAIKLRQSELAQRHGKYVPIALKIAPDLDDAQIAAIAALLMMHRIDAVIATNTTIAREAVTGLPHAEETGGLSGAPVRAASTKVVRELARHLKNEVPIIGVGGILSGDDAREKIDAGASLVQLYSGLIYRGPALVRECVKRLA
jgi:dihydroorotate dehydrogenase